MYAIRSYYGLSKGLFVKVNSQTAFNEGLQWMNQKLDGEIDFFEATPQFENGIAYANFDINPKQENSYYWFGSAEKQQASIGINDYNVITSYSIHYTKLYDHKPCIQCTIRPERNPSGDRYHIRQ